MIRSSFFFFPPFPSASLVSLVTSRAPKIRSGRQELSAAARHAAALYPEQVPDEGVPSRGEGTDADPEGAAA